MLFNAIIYVFSLQVSETQSYYAGTKYYVIELAVLVI